MRGVSVSVVGRPVVIPAQALFVVHAMGIGLWTVLIGGALVGRLSVIVPIVVLLLSPICTTVENAHDEPPAPVPPPQGS